MYTDLSAFWKKDSRCSSSIYLKIISLMLVMQLKCKGFCEKSKYHFYTSIYSFVKVDDFDENKIFNIKIFKIKNFKQTKSVKQMFKTNISQYFV